MKCKQCGKPLTDHRCESCGLIATWCNDKTGEVYTWRTIAEHEQACEDMQDMIDDAFDNQYFAGEGW